MVRIITFMPQKKYGFFCLVVSPKIKMMKKILIPTVLLCFAMACLGYIHIDNMNKIKKTTKLVEKSETTDQ